MSCIASLDKPTNGGFSYFVVTLDFLFLAYFFKQKVRTDCLFLVRCTTDCQDSE